MAAERLRARMVTHARPAAAGSYWDEAGAALDGLPSGGMNIAHEAVDRHASGVRSNRLAIRCLGPDEARVDLTYRQLYEATNRFAHALQRLGVGQGDTVCTLLGREAAWYVAALGTWKVGAVFCPLFPVFGAEPIRTRLAASRARVLVTSPRQYQRKIAALRADLPALAHVLTCGHDGALVPADTPFSSPVAAAGNAFPIVSTRADTPALLHFTSGTTGMPKGVQHTHSAVVAHYATARHVLDLNPDDVYWCTADAGWITGTCYGIIAPLVVGATLLADGGDFDAERWCRILQAEQVNVWYTSPTAIRLLMRLADEVTGSYRFPSLRVAASVGEPLNAEAVRWGARIFGTPFRDTWWQTETGAILIANLPTHPLVAGAMGRPLPGLEVAIVRRNETEALPLTVLHAAGETGELAVRSGWPSMFTGYVNDRQRYEDCFLDDWYLSGDLVRRDADGCYWFVGRADDAIKVAGHLIGPPEVERVLLAHPAVADAGVFGVPDPVTYEAVKAVVVTKPGVVVDEALRRDLHAYARRVLGPSLAPRDLAFCERLPKTLSGKVLRRLLRAQYLGLPSGDLSSVDPQL